MLLRIGDVRVGVGEGVCPPSSSAGSCSRQPSFILCLLLLFLQRHLQLALQATSADVTCSTGDCAVGGTVGADDTLQVVALLRGLTQVVGQTFAPIPGLRDGLGRLLLLGVVLGRVGRRALGMQQVLDQEVIVIVILLVLRALHSQHVGVWLGLGGCGVVRLRLGASGVGVALRRGQEGRGEDGGKVFVPPGSPGGLGRAGGSRRVQPRSNDAGGRRAGVREVV